MRIETVEHPDIIPKILDYDDAIEFFIKSSVVGGAYNTVNTKFGNENIMIWSYCPNIGSDLPYMEDVVDAVDHEFMHHLLYVLEGLWVTDCWDRIYWNIFYWLKDVCYPGHVYMSGKPDMNMIRVLRMRHGNPETKFEKFCYDFYHAGEFMNEKGNYRTITAEEVAEFLETSPQMAGRVLSVYDNMFRRKVINGKVVYEPKGWREW